MILRPYQTEGIRQIRQAYRDRNHRPLYVLPTGGGKTVMFTYIARNAAKKRNRVCIAVHRRELLHQTQAALEYEHGVIAPGFKQTDHPIQIASVQTLTRRVDKYSFDLIVIDEAHHAMARTYRRIIDANPGARVLGVTATPFRLDGKGLGDIFDCLIVGPSVTELTDAGYLARAEVYAPSVIDTSGLHTRAGDYVTSELDALVNVPSITGDAVETLYRHATRVHPITRRIKAIAFCVSVKHARDLAAVFRKQGWFSESVDGQTKQVIRDSYIMALESGNIDVLTSCEIISEGVDVPVVECGIMLRPTQSLALARQQMGRILRPSPGKKSAIILDHAGNCLRHGLPETPIEWTLEDRPKRKRGDDDPAVPIRQCKKCFHVHAPAPVCPMCGYVYEIESREVEERDGELERLEVVRQKKAANVEVGRARTKEELQRIAKERGYNPVWVTMIMRARRKGIA